MSGGASRRRRRARAVARLVGRRLLAMPVVVLAVAFGVFALAAASPFDPLAGYLGDRYLTTSTADQAQMAAALGTDSPWPAQFLAWLGGIAAGDLGHSRVFAMPVADVLAERLPWTLLLTVTSLVIAVVVAGGLALWSMRSRVVARAAVTAGHTIAAVPPFLLVLVAVAVLAVHTAVLPGGGVSPPGEPVQLTTVLRHLVLPAGVLAVTQVPWLLLHLRASLVAAYEAPHVRGARARGIPPMIVLLRHALPTSLLPFVTTVGVRVGELVAGVLVVEEMLAWPGVAGALVAAAVQVDFALLAALTVLASLAVLLGALVADVTYLAIDPRVVADG